MRLFALIGIILVLLLPFSYIRIDQENVILGDTSTTLTYGLLRWSSAVDTELFDSENSENIQSDWLEDGGWYDVYFGDLWIIGLLILIALIVGAVVAVVETKDNISSYILLVSGILLFILRFLHLSDNDNSFYETNTTLGTKTTYLEIPVALIIALIFSIIQMKKSK